MAANIHIDLSEEIEQDLLQKYQTLCGDLTQKLNSMEKELEGLCGQIRFKPIVKVVNATITLFNNDIFTTATKTFEEWKEGSGSFSAVAKNSQAGDAAIETAKKFEDKIKDAFDNFWIAHPMGEGLEIDTSRPKIKDEDFDNLKGIYTRFSEEVESRMETEISSIIELGNDDPTYNVIIPAVKAVTEPMKTAFKEFCAKIDKAKEDSENLKQQQSQHNDEASETATQTSASAADIASSLNMFDDI